AIKIPTVAYCIVLTGIITKAQSGIGDGNDNGDEKVEFFLCSLTPTPLPINYPSLSRDDLVGPIEKLIGQIKWVFDQQNHDKRDAQLLKVSLQPASFEDVIPSLKGSAPAEYLLPEINRHKVGNPDFQIDKLDKVSNRVKTFIDKMRDVVKNEKVATGTDESKTDTLVDDLLRIADLNVWPLKILIIIKEKPYVSADLEFVVANRKLNMVAVEWFWRNTNIIAGGDENIRATDNEEPIDETIFAMRVLSTYVTFYKAETLQNVGPDLVVVYQKRKLLLRDGQEKMLSGKVWI
ncbi:11355_t:CDS:2, partial [Ambispora leptoticha]